MTVPQIKVKVQRRAQVKLKVLPRFPSSVTGEDGIEVVNENGHFIIRPENGVLGDVVGPGAGADVAGQVAVFEDPTHIVGSGISYQNLAFEYQTLTAATLSTIPDYVEVVKTLGREAPGDNGGAPYVRTSPTTPSAWTFQSVDGQWWVLGTRTITPEMFGAFGDGEDCTAAFDAMETFINGIGGGVVINNNPGAVYQIWPEADGAPAALLMHLVGVDGVSWYWNGSRLETDNTFDPLERQSVIGLQNCSNFNIYSAEYVESAWSSLSLKGGLFWNIQEFEEPWSRNINFFNLKQDGGYATLYVASSVATAGGYASNINVFNAELNNVYYGLEFDKSGDNVTAVGIKGHNNGRIYVAANVSHHKVQIIADGGSVEQIVLNCLPHPTMTDDKRQTTDIQVEYRNVAPSAGPANTLCSLLMSQPVAQMTVSAIASNGSGGSRLTVNSSAGAATGQKWFANVTGTTAINGVQTFTVIDATHVDVAIPFVGTGTGYLSVPGAMKDIDLHFQCVNDEADGSNPLMTIGKLAFGGTADTSLRGYEFSNFRLSGSVKGYSSVGKAVQLFSDPLGGTWTGENINNVTVEDFSVEGTACPLDFNCAVVTNLLFKNVYGSSGTTWTFTGASSDTVFINVETPSLDTAFQIGASAATTRTELGLGSVVSGPASVTDDLPAIFDGTTGKLIKSKTYAAFKTLLALVKGDVGLGNVDNTSDATKNAATATLTNKTLTNAVVGTQSPGNNSTLAASTAYVDAAVAAKGTEAAITPTVNTSGTATTLGNGTLSGKAIRLGPTSVLVSIDFTVGSTTSFGTGYIYFSLPSPYNGAATAACSAVALFQDSGANFMGTVLMLSGTTQLIPLRGDATTSATSPFTWATGDVIRFSIIVIGI